MALEEMGPTYIKLGQFASTRPDLVPGNFIKELVKLRDEVEPLPFEDIEKVFIEDWGEYWREHFAVFSEELLGAASIAQVYRARLKNGREVAVKVRRPGVKRQISGDLGIIRFIARFIEKHFEDLKFLQPSRLAEEFSRNLFKELDYLREALTIRKIRGNHSDLKERVLIPEVIGDISTEKILVMEYVDGLPLEKSDLSVQESRDLARLGAEVLARQILRDGLFHADPHPGNLLYTFDGRLSYLDFGMVGRLSMRMRNELIDLLLAAYSNEPELILQEILILGNVDREVDRETLIRDIMEVSDRYLTVSLDEVSIGRALFDIFDVIRRHRITVHPAYTVVARAIMTAEETSRYLDRNINVLEEISPQLKKLFLKRFSPYSLWVNARILGKDLIRFANDMPSQLGQILRKLRTGQLEIEFRHMGLEEFMKTMDRVSNRISFSLVIAALIIGSSLVMHIQAGPMVMGIPALGFTGYVLAFVLGIWLLFSVIRSRKY